MQILNQRKPVPMAMKRLLPDRKPVAHKRYMIKIDNPDPRTYAAHRGTGSAVPLHLLPVPVRLLNGQRLHRGSKIAVGNGAHISFGIVKISAERAF